MIVNDQYLILLSLKNCTSLNNCKLILLPLSPPFLHPLLQPIYLLSASSETKHPHSQPYLESESLFTLYRDNVVEWMKTTEQMFSKKHTTLRVVKSMAHVGGNCCGWKCKEIDLTKENLPLSKTKKVSQIITAYLCVHYSAFHVFYIFYKQNVGMCTYIINKQLLADLRTIVCMHIPCEGRMFTMLIG